ncbi:type VI secretion system baseplate subunit TssK [Herbaspirillum robiniae]|uniref:Type VI secretion system baseplate subunit TssK n=1 Tax=Herbaspirillum robiniae TaxID=2014887 RepID=A0ABX2LS25_9BURK|nr:type VI secretion system baseplate subunit TssK [Herbaspirillum robiniae]
MNHSNKVLWGEGLFLRPQHFQRQDHYHETRLHQTAAALNPYCWGVSALQVDRDALNNNTLRILELSMIFQDGEIYKAPDGDDLPDPIELTEIPLAQQSVTFYAALPALKSFGSNFAHGAASNSQSSRYIQDNIETSDLFTEAAKAEMSYLKKAVRLVSENEPRDSLVCIPVVRLRRASSSGFELDPNFVPPSLSVHAAPLLFQRLRRLMDALQAKVSALYGHHREPSKSVVEFRSGDITSFWLLHTASTSYASLSHYLNNPLLHPERLYEQLLALGGSLMTFSRSLSLADLPAYDHHDPGPAFARLDGIIRELLDTVISSRYFAIALNESKPSYHLGMLDSGKIDDKTNFYLAVNADLPAIELVDVVPLRFKIGAPEDVEKFVLAALPGVKLVHSPQVPAALPVRPDTYYFALENKGAMYERMLQAQSICIYIPAGIRDLKLELLAVTQ